MKILLIGADGTIGKAIGALLSSTHSVIGVNHQSGEPRVDITDRASIDALFNHVGMVDAVICAAGDARFRPLAELTDEDFEFGLHHKLMGQVKLARIAVGWLGTPGSITLTSGVLAHEPMVNGSAISTVNAAIEGFVRGAALELRAGLRINAVSPPWITETVRAFGLVVAESLPAAIAARAYRQSVEGAMTGDVLDVRRYA